MKLNLNNEKTAAFLVGATVKEAMTTSNKFKNAIIKRNKENKPYNMENLHFIFTTAAKELYDLTLTNKDIDKLISTAAHYLAVTDSHTISKKDAEYYYTLGLTSAPVKIKDDEIYL